MTKFVQGLFVDRGSRRHYRAAQIVVVGQRAAFTERVREVVVMVVMILAVAGAGLVESKLCQG
jgi:hypothetical protein